jgi:hypothetical protein
MKPLMKKHFELLEAIQSNYKRRDKEPGALEKAIAACNQQIAIAPEVAQLFHQEFEELNQFAVEQGEQPLPETAAALPTHTGYTQLAILRNKQGRLAEAICLCREAQEQGWAGDWEKRIARYQKQQARNPEC